MSRSKSFAVKNPPILFKMSMWMIPVFLSIWAIQAITTFQLHLALLITIIILFVIPCTIVALWGKRYSVKVNGRSITLQRALRIEPLCFDVSEIAKVRCVIAETRAGQNTKITVYTSSCGKFSVETLMSNSDKMKEYLEEYAGRTIETVHKRIGV